MGTGPCLVLVAEISGTQKKKKKLPVNISPRLTFVDSLNIPPGLAASEGKCGT